MKDLKRDRHGFIELVLLAILGIVVMIFIVAQVVLKIDVTGWLWSELGKLIHLTIARGV